jgi:hypothetical protein
MKLYPPAYVIYASGRYYYLHVNNIPTVTLKPLSSKYIFHRLTLLNNIAWSRSCSFIITYNYAITRILVNQKLIRHIVIFLGRGIYIYL